jgi:MFS family permease
VSSALLESILINSIPSLTDYLGNYPDFAAHISHRTQYFGFYQRPYGLGGSYAETSSLIAILLSYFDIVGWRLSKRLKGASILSVLILMSGTGLSFLIFYLIITLLRSKYRSVVWPLCFAVLLIPLFVTLLPDFSDQSPAWKISWHYIYFLLQHKFKMLKIAEIGATDWYVLWFGNYEALRYEPLTWSDFGAGTLIYTFGFSGLALLFATFLAHANRLNVIPIALMLLSMGHYSAMFSQVGQLVFCIFLLTPGNYEQSKSSLVH